MNRYTLELSDMLKDDKFSIFDFEYDFYTINNGIRNNFEKKFEQQYYFHEINSETVARWKIMLRNRLNLIMPKYVELYRSIERCKEIDFMVNKDYEETITRELETNNLNTVEATTNTDSENSNNVKDVVKESNVANGVSDVSLTKGLTGVVENINSQTNKDNTINKNNMDNRLESNVNEIIKNSGKGNIGVTSASDLVKGWRESIINIDRMLIDECYDLFMLVY